MKKAIFLDRDGTLIEDKGYVYRIEDFKLLTGVIEGLSLLKKDYLLFIITNQSGIAKGFYTEKDFHKFHNFFLKQLNLHAINIGKTYFCPHNSESGCECRKPRTKYIEKIVSEFDVDLANSWVIGDHPSDILMGKNAGCKTAYLLTGHGLKHLQKLKEKRLEPTIIAKDFLSVAKSILESKCF